MSHRDQHSGTSTQANSQAVLSAMNEILERVDWQAIQFRRDCRWSIQGLVMAALIWAWSSNKTLTGRFARSLRIVRRLGKRFAPAELSYQGFLELLCRWTARLRSCLVRAFQDRMEKEFPDEFRFAGYVVLGGDGSKLLLARTVSNQSFYSHAKPRKKKPKDSRRSSTRAKSRKSREQQSRNKKADSPLMAMTALLHVGLRLPWDWRLGPSDISEREQLRSMIADLPPDTLLTADCGFFGYEFWSELIASGRQFVIRVGGNVRMLRKLGVARESHGTVYLWPDSAAKRRQPPLVLRLVEIHDGRQSWFLVTSVVDQKRLSDQQIIQIYSRRWRVELFFRDFKQTFGRSKLLSHKATHAECEAEWSLLGLWAMLLYARIQQKNHPPQTEEVTKVSVARVISAFAQAIQEFNSSPDHGDSLTEQLNRAVVDSYQRKDKRSRGYPRKKYETQAKPPRIYNASKAQRQAAKQVMANTKQKPLA